MDTHRKNSHNRPLMPARQEIDAGLKSVSLVIQTPPLKQIETQQNNVRLFQRTARNELIAT
jgi:hypothetical protein